MNNTRMYRPKGRDRYEKYNIARHIDYVLNASNPRMKRAVRLYQIQIAILLGTRLRNSQQRKRSEFGSWIRISRSVLQTARIVSTMRIFEYIINQNFPQAKNKYPLQAMLHNEETNEILQFFTSSNNLKNIGYGLSWHSLDLEIVNRRHNQKTFASLYDISIRFLPTSNPLLKCPWSRAIKVLDYNQREEEYDILRKYYPKLQSADTAYRYKDEKDYLAGFIWLDHFYGHFFRPLRPFDASFASKLLSKNDDLDGLYRFFGQYEAVEEQLRKNGYTPLKLRLAAPITKIDLSIKPLPALLQEWIQQ